MTRIVVGPRCREQALDALVTCAVFWHRVATRLHAQSRLPAPYDRYGHPRPLVLTVAHLIGKLLFMTEYTLKFSPSAVADTGTFKLLELPSDLSKLVEESSDNLPRQAHYDLCCAYCY